MPAKKDSDQQEAEDSEGRSALVEQTSFIDEHSPMGKQFGDGRKVADLDRVGGMAPDADPDETEAPAEDVEPEPPPRH